MFIVHGHDGELKESVARTIETLGIEAVILSEQANQGMTIIEKIEKHSDVNAAIVLLTSDDILKDTKTDETKKRPRQNALFEAGYFMGKLGRNNVIIIIEEDIEMPSDLQGLVYHKKEGWKIEIYNELKKMGFPIDLNRIS